MAVPTKVKCPACRKAGDWFAGAWGPFCSRRCKLIDLGKWFNEEHVIHDELRPDLFEEFEKAEGGGLDKPAPE